MMDPKNIEFEFSKNDEHFGRELRTDSIIEMHGGIENAAKHLLSFYKTRGAIRVQVSYNGKKFVYNLDV
jgi:hypothetical protein